MTSAERKAVLLDYQYTTEFVNRMDAVLFQIRSWSGVACAAVISYAVSKNSIRILSANVLLGICFLFIELIYKSFHENGISHSHDLEEIIHYDAVHSGGAPLPRGYQFGIGHAIQAPTLKRLLKILTNRRRWHIHVFYLLILFVSALAGLLIFMLRT